ncbi:secretin N-terminal domain-containing protein [Aeoliella sp.]|uniref:secretin N-terminal domain-containing protein n=1 Tax=Aeoliella sp. TaxID=2795800 RepID=UPI003CCB7D59
MNRLFLIPILSLVMACSALAQMEAKPAKEDSYEIKIFELQNLPASEAQQLLSAVVGKQPGESIAVDARRNSVIARGPLDRLQVIEALLLKLDTPSEQPQATLTVYPLRYIAAEKLLKMVDALLSNSSRVGTLRLGIDESSNAIIAVATPDEHKVLQSIIEHVDKENDEGSAGSAQSIRLEVFWIAEGEEASKVPAEIAQIISDQNELLGISNPKVLASATVAAYLSEGSTNGPIVLEGIKTSDGRQLDCVANIDYLGEQAFKFGLRLTAYAKTKTSIETTIRAKLGHPVFMASTTTGDDSDKPTVFVLRITE